MVDLEAAEKLASRICEMAANGQRSSTPTGLVADTIRDLVEEVRRLQRVLDKREKHEAIALDQRDEARRQLADLKAESDNQTLAALTTASNALQERNDAQKKLAIARKALKRVWDSHHEEYDPNVVAPPEYVCEALAEIDGGES